MTKAARGKASSRATEKKKRPPGRLPTKGEIVEWLETADAKTTKRDIARAFNIKGDDRIAFKALLREMSEEGLIDRGRKKNVSLPGKLPPVTVLDIIERDADGELIARPAHWEGEDAAPSIVLAPGDAHKGPAPGVGDRVLARLSVIEEEDSLYAYEGRVIRRIGQSAHRVLGVFSTKGREGRIKPVDRRTRFELFVRADETAGAEDGELVEAVVKGGAGYGLKAARIVERLGSLDDPRTISLIAIHAHNIPTVFPEAALAEAEEAKQVTLKGREDLRHLPLVTIDPFDARDHDDAVFAEADTDPANPDGWIVWVAIADVAHYVTPGSALDKEARKRGNSCYFPDRVVPMLPERLSNGLCSLEEGADRACLAARMVFDREGIKKSHRFVRGLMRSPGSLSYEEVQAAIDGHGNERTSALLKDVLRPLYAAYAALCKARAKRAPLDLDLPEFKVQLGKDGKVASIAPRTRLEAHKLIEEFMIQANVAAAEALEKKRTPLIYRVHEPPAREKLIALTDFLNTIDIHMPKGQGLSTRQFNQVLKKAEGADVGQMVSEIILRSQSQAYYAPHNLGHFGLHLQKYAHFTSPIRRYADLIVHRALIRAFGFGDGGLTDTEIAELDGIGEDISTLERRAMAAERDSNDRYIAAYMEDRVGADFEGRITGVTRFGLFVRLEGTGADGLIPIANLGQEYFQHNEKAHALIGSRTGLTFRLGMTVTVKLVEAAPVTGGLRFDLIEGGAAGHPERAKGPKKTKRRR